VISLLHGLRAGWHLPNDLSDGDRRTVIAVLTNGFAKALARGGFVALSVIYLSSGLRIDEQTVAVAVFIAGAFGLIGSLFGGFVADHFSPKAVTVGSSCGVAVGYGALVFCDDWLMAVIAFSVVAAFDRSSAATLATWIGQRLPTAAATRCRALMRAVGNLGIAIGAALAAVVLVLPAPIPYAAAFLAMAVAEVGGILLLLRAPQPKPVDVQRIAGGSPLSVFGNHGFTVFVIGIAALSSFYLILDFLLPLWVSTGTEDRYVLIPVAIVVNTVLVVLLQVPVSSLADTPSRSARALALAGGLLFGATALFSASTLLPDLPGASLFCGAVVVLTLAELLTSAAGWTLSYAYAPPHRIGAYQGVFGFGTSLGVMVAPVALTAIVIRPSVGETAAGWLILGGAYAMIGGLLWVAVSRRFSALKQG
jgi:MFS family permease